MKATQIDGPTHFNFNAKRKNATSREKTRGTKRKSPKEKNVRRRADGHYARLEWKIKTNESFSSSSKNDAGRPGTVQDVRLVELEDVLIVVLRPKSTERVPTRTSARERNGETDKDDQSDNDADDNPNSEGSMFTRRRSRRRFVEPVRRQIVPERFVVHLSYHEHRHESFRFGTQMRRRRRFRLRFADPARRKLATTIRHVDTST